MARTELRAGFVVGPLLHASQVEATPDGVGEECKVFALTAMRRAVVETVRCSTGSEELCGRRTHLAACAAGCSGRGAMAELRLGNEDPAALAQRPSLTSQRASGWD